MKVFLLCVCVCVCVRVCVYGRAKSVCSMSDFQRLMDSSPFLPDKASHLGERGGGRDRGEVTPPLSPDDLKYIEEFNSKGWELANALSASCPIPGPLMDTWDLDDRITGV